MLPRSAFSSEDEYLAYLRDWFAGQALAGYIAHLGSQDIHVGSYTDECAAEAYRLADAMLAARSKGEEA